MAPGDPTFADMLDAFMHPPRVVEIGHRYEDDDGQILIVSAVEVWPFRTVVRGVTASRRTKPGKPFEFTGIDASDPPDDPQDLPRIDTVELVRRRRESMLGDHHRAHAEAMMSWRLDDDAGTVYRVTGWRGGGSMWSDFQIEFDPGTPSGASELTITPTIGPVVSAHLG